MVESSILECGDGQKRRVLAAWSAATLDELCTAWQVQQRIATHSFYLSLQRLVLAVESNGDLTRGFDADLDIEEAEDKEPLPYSFSYHGAKID